MAWGYLAKTYAVPAPPPVPTPRVPRPDRRFCDGCGNWCGPERVEGNTLIRGTDLELTEVPNPTDLWPGRETLLMCEECAVEFEALTQSLGPHQGLLEGTDPRGTSALLREQRVLDGGIPGEPAGYCDVSQSLRGLVARLNYP